MQASKTGEFCALPKGCVQPESRTLIASPFLPRLHFLFSPLVTLVCSLSFVYFALLLFPISLYTPSNPHSETQVDGY
jgi:hypothetical protein